MAAEDKAKHLENLELETKALEALEKDFEQARVVYSLHTCASPVSQRAGGVAGRGARGAPPPRARAGLHGPAAARPADAASSC